MQYLIWPLRIDQSKIVAMFHIVWQKYIYHRYNDGV